MVCGWQHQYHLGVGWKWRISSPRRRICISIGSQETEQQLILCTIKFEKPCLKSLSLVLRWTGASLAVGVLSLALPSAFSVVNFCRVIDYVLPTQGWGRSLLPHPFPSSLSPGTLHLSFLYHSQFWTSLIVLLDQNYLGSYLIHLGVVPTPFSPNTQLSPMLG